MNSMAGFLDPTFLYVRNTNQASNSNTKVDIEDFLKFDLKKLI